MQLNVAGRADCVGRAIIDLPPRRPRAARDPDPKCDPRGGIERQERRGRAQELRLATDEPADRQRVAHRLDAKECKEQRLANEGWGDE